MADEQCIENRVKDFRLQRGWSQATLAQRAGISRPAVSAIEIQRLVPSVASALALAKVFGCSVEDLFGVAPASSDEHSWAWNAPSTSPTRVFCARVEERTLLYPAEPTALGVMEHDGVWAGDSLRLQSIVQPQETLVVACCDPAAGILASCYRRETPFRMLAFSRSSRQALELLKNRSIHAAGLHLSSHDDADGNAAAVAQVLGKGYTLLRLSVWREGLALAPDVAARSIRSVVAGKWTWVGREVGSGARQCLDELLEGRPAPRRIARDHRGVAEAVRNGWAQVGVCHQFSAEDAGLQFLSIRQEAFDLCFASNLRRDPRIEALVRVVQSADYRQILGELPGFDVSTTGEQRVVES
jgi:molybdate-binding protein/DNA-binding XRE family transcriptional regulator